MALDKAQIRILLLETADGKTLYKQIVYRFLQSMYSRQTADEQEYKTTHHSNGKGFNARDAKFLSDVASKSKKWNGLTDNQAKFVAKTLVKYAGQLADISAINQL